MDVDGSQVRRRVDTGEGAGENVVKDAGKKTGRGRDPRRQSR